MNTASARHVLSAAQPLRESHARTARKALALARRDGGERVIHERARLHLDERDGVAAHDDQVDFAAGRRIAAGEGAVAFRDQEQDRDPLGAVAAQKGHFPSVERALHSPFLASTRARA
jgi:hypothetical protein